MSDFDKLLDTFSQLNKFTEQRKRERQQQREEKRKAKEKAKREKLLDQL